MGYIKKILSMLFVFIILMCSFEFGTYASENVYGVTYRDSLSKCEAVFYDTFLKNCEIMKNGESQIKIYFPESVLKDDVSGILQRASAAFVLDHPECFWISYERLSFSYVESNGCVDVITVSKDEEKEYYFPKDYISPSEVEQDIRLLKEKTDEIIRKAQIYRSQYEKIKYFHDYLCKNNVYNVYVRNGEDDKAHPNAWRALSALAGDNDAKKGPVCEGYSKAFKILCDCAGIPCVLIPGEGISNGERDAHMWCAVQLSGKWYGVDVTWDDAVMSDGTNVMREDYFLCGENTGDFASTHIPDMEKYFLTSLPVPKLTEEKYSASKSKDGFFLSLSDFSAVYGEKSQVEVTLSDELVGQKISLYKNSVSENNRIYSGKTENNLLFISVDTKNLSCVNDKKIIAVYEDEKGNSYASCADIILMPKMLELDSSHVCVSYTSDKPYISGELMFKTGEKISYDVKSEISEDGKKMTVYYTDIVPPDLNYTSDDSLVLEFELSEQNEQTEEIYKYTAPALIVIFCVIVSLLKRK